MSSIVCGPLPLIAALGVFVPPKSDQFESDKQYYNPQDPKAWPSHSDVSYTFIDGEPSLLREELVKDAIAEFTSHANVNLVLASNSASANIRISFKDTGRAWSAIGIDALKIRKEQPTMSLGFIPTELGSADRQDLYNITLHEFGHAFGLAHEWNTGWVERLTGETRNDAIKQHKAAFEDNDTSNFPKVGDEVGDEDSIMKFFVPKDYTPGTSQKTAVTLKGGLSAKDKAWLTLIYPGKAGGEHADNGTLKSLEVLKMPLVDSSRILLDPTVSEMRYHYHKYISTTYGDRLGAVVVREAVVELNKRVNDGLELMPESHVLEGKVTGTTPLVDHNNEDDLYDSVAAAVMDPQFHLAIANVVNKGEATPSSPDVQHFIGPLISILGPLLGLSSAIPSGAASGISPYAPAGAQHFIGPLIATLGPLFGQLLGSVIPKGAASGIYSQGALPPEVQQGIFNMFTDFLKKPVFRRVVQGVAADMIERTKLKGEETGEGEEGSDVDDESEPYISPSAR